MSSEIITKIERERMIELLGADKRIDGRDLNDYREIKAETGLIEKAAGSALVSIGKTKVLVGIKIETGEPFLDRPDEGVLTTNVELLPMASPTFESGPPGEEAIELARVVDRGIRESKAVDLKKLCIKPKEKVFVVFIDIYVLDYEGNLFDTSALASMLALTNTKMANFTVGKNGEVKIKPGVITLPVQNYPVSITLAKINDKLIVDPSLKEERIANTLITMAIDKDGHLCAMQKMGCGVFSSDDLLKIFDIARKKSEEIRKDVMGV